MCVFLCAFAYANIGHLKVNCSKNCLLCVKLLSEPNLFCYVYILVQRELFPSYGLQV